MTKQMIAIAPQAKKIDARNGGSITKNMIAPEMSARMLARIATTTHIRRSCPDMFIAGTAGIASVRVHLRDGVRLLQVP